LKGDTRKRFLTGFDDYISNKLQEKGFCCWLRSIYNWIKKSNKDKLWKGKYKCLSELCHLKFQAEVTLNLNESLDFSLTWYGTCSHTKFKPGYRIVKNERSDVAVQLISNGLSNYISENIISNQVLKEKDGIKLKEYFLNNSLMILNYIFYSEKAKPTNLNTLKMIKSQYVNRNRISTNIMIDTEACKVFSDIHCLISDVDSLKGYIQEINQNPFGLVLISDIQV
jgi:hypothetical protein